MKNKNIFFTGASIVTMLLGMQSFAQTNAAQAQPVKKTNTITTSNSSSNTNLAPWQKQRIQPKNTTTTTTKAPLNAKPEQAQPIQHK